MLALFRKRSPGYSTMENDGMSPLMARLMIPEDGK
jgi:hypothetical protein